MMPSSTSASRALGTSFVALSLLATSADARTWTSAKNGKTLEAEFVELTDSAVVVEMADGKKRTLPLDSLIEEDRAEAKKLQDKAEGFGIEERPELPDDDGPTEFVIRGVHLCCDKAEEELIKAAGSAGSVAKVNERVSQVILKAPSSADAQKAVDAIVDAGFFGDVSAKKGSPDVKFYSGMPRPSTVEKASFSLPNQVCCEQAVESLNDAILDASGVEEGKVSLGAYDFTITGEFDPTEIIESIRAFGYNATQK